MTTIYDFDPRNLPTDLLAAIGLSITSFAQTEQFIQEAIAGCCGLDVEYGKALTIHMPMPLRFSVLRSAAEIRIDDLDVLDELDRRLDLIDECIKKRNYMAHRMWCRDRTTGALFTVKEDARSRLEMDLLPMTVDQVKADALFTQCRDRVFSIYRLAWPSPALSVSSPSSRSQKQGGEKETSRDEVTFRASPRSEGRPLNFQPCHGSRTLADLPLFTQVYSSHK